MLRKVLAGTAAAVALFSASNATADRYDPNDPCLLHAGCFWDGDEWICADYVYALCVSDAADS